MPRPKILYVITYAFPTRFLRGTLAFMKSKGYEPIICSTAGPELTETAKLDDVEYIELNIEREIKPLADLRSLWALYRLMRRIKPAVCVTGTPKASLLGNIAAYFAGVPVRIMQLRGLRLETTTGLKRRVLWLTEKIAAMTARQIWPVSKSLTERYLALKLAPAKKIKLFGAGSSHGVDARHFDRNRSDLQRTANELRIRYNLREGCPVIGFIGRMTKDKGIGELADAFKIVLEKYPMTQLVIVGPDAENDAVDPAKIDFLKNHPQVVIVGNSFDVAPWYCLFDLLAFPSYREGFPNVVLEAAAMQLPVVGFNVTGTVDAIDDGKTGWVVPGGDVSELASAILRYLDDSALRLEHGANARHRIIRDFRPEDIWQSQYEEIGKAIAEKNKVVGDTV